MKKNIKVGSCVYVQEDGVELIGVVKSIEGTTAVIEESLFRVNGKKDWMFTKDKYPEYNGEELHDLDLIDGHYFDVLYDKTPPKKRRSIFKDLMSLFTY